MSIPDLDLMTSAAHEAGKIALKYYGKQIDVEIKPEAGNSPVTIADTEIDTYLRETLIAARPDYGWLSEETADDLDRLNKEYVWVVDPIDGTKSFIEGHDMFAISIGLVQNGKPIVGVVFNPVLEEMFCAAIGHGVFKNGEKVLPSDEQDIFSGDCLISVSEQRKGLWAPIEAKGIQTRSVHSIACKLALVASGEAMMMASLRPKSEWDVAAGHVLCAEMGLVVTDIDGHDVTYNNRNTQINKFIVAPKNLYDSLKKIIHES